MQTILSIAEFRKNCAALMDRAAQGERILVGRRGKALVALTPITEAERQAEEDRLDKLAADRARRQFEKSGEKLIPLEDAARELGFELPKRKASKR